VPGPSGVGQIHRNLGILDPTRGPGVLALRSDRGGALLDIAGLINHQHRARITEVFYDVVAQVIANPIGVPHRATEQVLHAIRASIPGVLGDRPAVLAR
jgi:hypothetical protein